MTYCVSSVLTESGTLSPFFSLNFNGHFPGEPGLAVFIEAKDDRGGGDNRTTGAISRAKL